MGEDEVTKVSKVIQKNDSNKHLGLTGPAVSTFLVKLTEKLQNRLKLPFKKSTKDDDGKHLAFSMAKDKGSSAHWEVNLKKQLQAWRENPVWADQSPDIEVTVPKGSLCKLNARVNVGLPPDAVYNIVIDPDNRRVFKNIKDVISRRVLLDEGLRQVVEVEQAALWRFLWWSGTISVHVLVDQNREDYSMKFKQVKTGFMKRFEGCWRVEPLFVDEKLCLPFKPKSLEDYLLCTEGKGRIGSKVSLEQLLQPSIVPPPPISWYVRGITIRTTEMLVYDLLAETARIRGVYNTEDTKGELGISEGLSDECQVNKLRDIKERWALRRRNAKQRRKRLPM